VVSFIERLTRGLTDFPEIGQRSDEMKVRVILAGRFPYRIYYGVETDEIVILHIRHAARDTPEAGEM